LIFPEKAVFLGAVPAFRLLAVIGVLYGYIIPVGAVFTSMGRPDIPLKITIFNLIITIVLLVLLVPLDMIFLGFQIGGINGAALAFGVTMLFNVLIHIILIKKMVPIHINFRMMFLGSVLFLGVMGLAYFASNYINGNVVGAIIIPIFSVCLYYFGIVTMGGFKKAISMLKKQ
jgi:O-antigen/teichoic acid export membrane protein